MIIPESDKIEKYLCKKQTKYYSKKFKEIYKGECGHIVIFDNGDIAATQKHVKFFMGTVINDPNVLNFKIRNLDKDKEKIIIKKLLSE
jgi:hypothetical protein